MATMISQIVAFGLLFLGTRRGDTLRIHFKRLYSKLIYYKGILRGGVPALCRQSIGSFSIILLNTAAARMGDQVVAAFSIVGRIMMFMVMIVIGLGQGFQPICGFQLRLRPLRQGARGVLVYGEAFIYHAIVFCRSRIHLRAAADFPVPERLPRSYENRQSGAAAADDFTADVFVPDDVQHDAANHRPRTKRIAACRRAGRGYFWFQPC